MLDILETHFLLIVPSIFLYDRLSMSGFCV